MNYKHTPGPWLLADDGSPFVYALNDQGINRFSLSVSRGFVDDKLTNPAELRATAQLIAAAPDVLAALASIVEMNPELPMGMIEAAREAVIKATGLPVL